MGIAYAFRIEKMKSSGAPVEWVDTLNPIVTSINGIGLSAKPNHPNAAKLFVDFALSKKGQEVILKRDRIPARMDVKPAPRKLDQANLKLKVVPGEVHGQISEYAKEYRRLFGF